MDNQWIIVKQTNQAMHWKAINPLDSVIQPLNNSLQKRQNFLCILFCRLLNNCGLGNNVKISVFSSFANEFSFLCQVVYLLATKMSN